MSIIYQLNISHNVCTTMFCEILNLEKNNGFHFLWFFLLFAFNTQCTGWREMLGQKRDLAEPDFFSIM